jgi:hypothetical protein
MLTVAKGATQASAGIRLVAGAGAVAAKGIALATAATAEFLVPLLIVAGAIYIFNKGMEAVGLSSEKAEAKLAGFNAEAEKAAAAASAAKEAADLFKTVERTLPNMRNDGDRRRMLSQAAEATHGDIEDDPAARARAVEQTRTEWELLLKQGEAYEGIGRFAGINKALEAERAKQLQRNFDLLQDEYEARARGMRANAEEIARLERAQRGPFRVLGGERATKGN